MRMEPANDSNKLFPMRSLLEKLFGKEQINFFVFKLSVMTKGSFPQGQPSDCDSTELTDAVSEKTKGSANFSFLPMS